MVDGKNETASTVRADNTAFRNKTVNLPVIQRSQSRVDPVTTCRERGKIHAQYFTPEGVW